MIRHRLEALEGSRVCPGAAKVTLDFEAIESRVADLGLAKLNPHETEQIRALVRSCFTEGRSGDA